MKIEIDSDSGFCFGVVTAIRKAEEELSSGTTLYCLGDIVHNSDEVQRLSAKGLKVITHDDLRHLSGVKVLLRAHGEPPSTYALAKSRNIEIIDATCPVVLRLQQRIKQTYDSTLVPRPQIVIYGKRGHAEVNGLVGQTAGEAIVVENIDDLAKIDFTRNVALYSQTTKSLDGFRAIADEIRQRLAPEATLETADTICRQVANRVENLRRFARSHDVVVFVAGKKSSNGKVLYGNCLEENPNTHLVSNADELQPQWFDNADSVGICGATSTPRWLMEKVRDCLAGLRPPKP